MALSRAIMYFIRQRHVLPYNKTMVVSNSIVCYPFSTSQHIYLNKHLLTKSEKNESDNKLQVDFVEEVKDKTKLLWQSTIFLVGLSGVGVLFYFVYQELFSSNSTNAVYTKAFNVIKNDSRIIDIFGEKIKAYGEETRRGRRGHVSHFNYEKNGVAHMKMKFHIQGSDKKGTVHLEVKKNTEGNWMYRYLFVQLNNRPRSVIVLEDNRGVDNTVYTTSKDSEELMPPNLKLT